MRAKITVIAVCVALIAVAVGGAIALDIVDAQGAIESRYHQHREAQQFSDLSAADQLAASSASTDAETFASHLPVVSIDTRGQEVPGERIRGASAADQAVSVDIDDTDLTYEQKYTVAADGWRTIATDFSLYSADGQANRLSDDPALQTQAEIRYRGHSSRLFDKKSYAVTFTEADRVTNRNLDVLGMGADEDWVLNGPFLDKTLIRNYLSMNVVAQFMPYVPDVRFCELFVNGEYQGVYLLMETIKEGDDRVSLNATDANSAATSYLVRRDWREAGSASSFDDLLYNLQTVTETEMSIAHPSTTTITEAQKAWIASDINRIEKALYSYDYDTADYGYWNNIDVDSFVDYAVFNEFALNSDAGLYSTYFYKDIRGNLCAGPIWDFNNAYNNYMETDFSEIGFVMVDSPLYYMLYKDERFVDQVIDRYRELRQTYLSEDELCSYIDETVAYLGPAIQRNYEVWGYSFDPEQVGTNDKLSPDERNPRSFEEAIDDLKRAIHERGSFLDEYIVNLKQYSHESAVKPYNH